MRKKFTTMVLSAILAVTTLGGCGGNGGATSSAAGGDKSHSGETLFIDARLAGFGEWLNDYIAEFEDETGCTVEIYWNPTENESIRNIFNSTDYVLSDLYFGVVTDLWYTWAQKGKLYEISGFDDLLQDAYAEHGVYNGKRYVFNPVASPLGFVYNRDYINQLPSNGAFKQGEFPETFEGLMDLCEVINQSSLSVGNTKVKPFSWGGKVGELDELFRVFWAQGNGGKDWVAYTNDDGETPTESLYKNNKSLKNALTAMSRLIDSDGSYSKNSVEGCGEKTNIQQQQDFLNGKSVFCMTGGWFETEMKNYIREDSAKYAFANVPLYDESETVRTSLINIPTEAFIIPKDAENPELALEFLQFVFSVENAVSVHTELGTPLTLKYDFTESDMNGLKSDFARQVTNVVRNTVPVTKYSNSPMCMTGGVSGGILDAFGNSLGNLFGEKMMKNQSGYTLNDIDSIVSNNWLGYQKTWSSKLGTAGLD